MIKRAPLVYGLLVLVLAAIVAWQIAEHKRVCEAARADLRNSAHDITTTLGVVIRSQRFGPWVPQDRLESALQELAESDELVSVALLNVAGEVVVSAGDPIQFDTKGIMPPSGERWTRQTVTVVNPVDLGAAVSSGDTNQLNRPTIILPAGEDRRFLSGRRGSKESGSPNLADRPSPPPPGDPEARENRSEPRSRSRRGPPPWMDPERFRQLMENPEFKALVEKQGLHGLAIALSTDAYHTASTNDLWIRCLVVFFGLVSALGIALAWRNLGKSSEFEMRLLRASELNSHLREMNVAAAGLAHETRNPLNIIRGLAQIISKNQNASHELKENASRITSEVDLVTAQLNEFINYSKPRELRRTAVDIHQVMADVVRALQTDLEDKEIKFTLSDEPVAVDADERMLRQIVFNLLLNAIQAVDRGGEIALCVKRQNGQGALLEIRDNGPGVAPEHREEIFRPYFTTHQQGTGLGLAVVRQIVLAHGWDIECASNGTKGAVFRVSRIKLVPKTQLHP